MASTHHAHDPTNQSLRYTKRMGITPQQYISRHGVVIGLDYTKTDYLSLDQQRAAIARMDREKSGDFWGYFCCSSCEYWSVWKYSDRRDDGSPCDKCGRREGAEDADEDWHECEHAELGRDCPRTCDFDNDPGSTFKLFVYYWRTLDVVRIYGQQNFVDAENEIWEEEHAESP